MNGSTIITVGVLAGLIFTFIGGIYSTFDETPPETSSTLTAVSTILDVLINIVGWLIGVIILVVGGLTVGAFSLIELFISFFFDVGEVTSVTEFLSSVLDATTDTVTYVIDYKDNIIEAFSYLPDTLIFIFGIPILLGLGFAIYKAINPVVSGE